MPAFHYLFSTKLITRHDDGEFKFFEVEKKFENENPILARREVFKEYQNYLEIFLEAKNKRYSSDKQARKDFDEYTDFDPESCFVVDDKIIKYKDIYSIGIGVFFVIDVPIKEKYDFLDDNPGILSLIHGIGKGLYNKDLDYLSGSLLMEFEYYSTYKYPTFDDEIEIQYCNRDEWLEGYRENEPGLYRILKTPFDWSDFKEPYWWGNPEKNDDNENYSLQSFKEIIEQGESNQIEFKPALLYNYSTKKAGIGIKQIIAKSICSFLNSNGGILFIGVNDDKTIQGLSDDFSLSDKPNVKDFFRIEFDNMIKKIITSSVLSNINADFYLIDNKEIFIVNVFPLKKGPVFLNGQFGKEFYVRGQASSLLIKDQKEIEKYCTEKWGDDWNKLV